ncbi:hypothetical protein AYI70_g8125 [Smittium culicis]|uniref:Uncharacterized protein n=1 Tax=Smittium culicis TaxID=133412 RepID=A0A1R1XHC8_9FUNG|nr:hypothetical protein AYI70_g8125 [Smittium culicis]
MGLFPDRKSDQTLITADGRSHNTKGIISELPVTIAGNKFEIDCLVMENERSSLILGIDWLKKFDAVIDIKNQELVLPLDNCDVVLSLSTNIEKEIKNGLRQEFFGIGKEFCEILKYDESQKVDERILVLNTK